MGVCPLGLMFDIYRKISYISHLLLDHAHPIYERATVNLNMLNKCNRFSISLAVQ